MMGKGVGTVATPIRSKSQKHIQTIYTICTQLAFSNAVKSTTSCLLMDCAQFLKHKMSFNIKNVHSYLVKNW